ncbi:AraC family transcriptional regulator [Burkholderia vietnamiensis]|uniref:AraC family transcriptional regulator n=1 Tax=Burkholderia vietnamiensis TaxID=60552 RepID=UPI00075A74EA|nr:AraC family transcriptional regulator [Burkholderia vietnamiensis]KVS16964.1 AraC family transcriptional regulator [Burkholderia vietnamiensis]MBE0632754.1 AraC family transcriptional regulator [Burkholderia vietnamiensis]MCA7944883.1 AraC family transcriptional regulator [Burkholderia vietnamiensis]MCA7984368.1 AraC family transcriptional regulator [Burkholderia vietnamiensis]MCA8449306.1 AraC family transcriptional regulator [Burkholderia vietnamiensis]
MHRVTHYRRIDEGIEAISLDSDRSFPRHAHDEFGVGVIVSGAHRSWSGRGQVDALAGDAIMVNPGEMHDGMPIDAGTGRRWRMLYLAPALVAGIAAEEGIGGVELANPAVRDERLAAAFARLHARVVAGNTPHLARDEALVMLVAALLARHSNRTLRAACVVPAIRAARERLDAAPAEPASLAELAGLGGVSRFQLLRGFARELGITPHAYLMQSRTRLARALLASGRPIADAAAEAGFADQSHLTRAFARQFGITPGRFLQAG